MNMNPADYEAMQNQAHSLRREAAQIRDPRQRLLAHTLADFFEAKVTGTTFCWPRGITAAWLARMAGNVLAHRGSTAVPLADALDAEVRVLGATDAGLRNQDATFPC
ncbi:MAG: hypothetical protein IT381_10390 [Deltaproteobacteria bacterium]|nr:hypothetical protein [Deltaproteobacteria bacterium]